MDVTVVTLSEMKPLAFSLNNRSALPIPSLRRHTPHVVYTKCISIGNWNPPLCSPFLQMSLSPTPFSVTKSSPSVAGNLSGRRDCQRTRNLTGQLPVQRPPRRVSDRGRRQSETVKRRTAQHRDHHHHLHLLVVEESKGDGGRTVTKSTLLFRMLHMIPSRFTHRKRDCLCWVTSPDLAP